MQKTLLLVFNTLSLILSISAATIPRTTVENLPECCKNNKSDCSTLSKPSATSTASITSASATPATCNLTFSASQYISTSAILPVSSSSPNIAIPPFENSMVLIAPANSTIFTFKVSPPSSVSELCNLIFAFPYGSDATPYTFSGIEAEVDTNGGLNFALLSSNPDTEGTTFANMPAVAEDYGKITVLPGNVYKVGRAFKCQAGKSLSVLVSSVGAVFLRYLQDDGVATGRSALGLFVTACD